MRGKTESGGDSGLTPTQLIGWLIGINVAIFLLPALTGWGYVETATGGYRLGGYSTSALLRGELWTLFTYQFVHQDILHISLNMLGLFFLGRHAVQALGTAAFLLLYLAGGVSGALLESFAKGIFGIPTAVVGASAAVSAVLAIFVALMPQTQLQIFPFPFLIKARTLLWAFLAINAFLGLLGLFLPKSDVPSTAYFAHCGGALYGLLHARFLRRGIPSFSFSFRPPPPKTPTVKYSTRPDDSKIIDAQFAEPQDGDYNAVLDKINREGIASLTPLERRILQQASEKLSREKR